MGPSKNTGDTYGRLTGKALGTSPRVYAATAPDGMVIGSDAADMPDAADVMGHVDGSCPQSKLPASEAARHASMQRAASSAKRDGPVGRLPRAGYALT